MRMNTNECILFGQHTELTHSNECSYLQSTHLGRLDIHLNGMVRACYLPGAPLQWELPSEPFSTQTTSFPISSLVWNPQPFNLMLKTAKIHLESSNYRAATSLKCDILQYPQINCGGQIWRAPSAPTSQPFQTPQYIHLLCHLQNGNTPVPA